MDSFVHDGYRFEVSEAGPATGPPVILLHGFPADRQCWSGVTPRLNEAGYRTLAFDQRGYSPQARPTGRRQYRMPLLAGDVLALADQAGAGPIHVVGHDWGAALAWYLAAHHPDRLRTVTALSVPHTRALVAALGRSTQLLHSWYVGYFQLPWLPELTLSMGRGSVLRRQLQRSGLGAEAAARYAERARSPGGFTGPLNWYRAIPAQVPRPLPRVEIPALFVWGDRDVFLTRAAAERCADFVTGPYRAELLPGVSHWIPEEEPERTAALLVEHLAGTG